MGRGVTRDCRGPGRTGAGNGRGHGPGAAGATLRARRQAWRARWSGRTGRSLADLGRRGAKGTGADDKQKSQLKKLDA